MKRAAIIIAVIWALAAAGPAMAGRQTREPAPLPDLIEDTSCGFLVLVTFPVNSEYAITFYDALGNAVRINVTGHLVVRFTNPASGASITANISGPAHIDLVNGTSFGAGVTGGPVVGLPGLSLFAGRINFVTGELRGHVKANVCALLAT